MFIKIVRLKYPVIYFSAALGMAGLLIFPKECADAARDSLLVCINVVIPTLFPFFVFSSFAVESGLSTHMGKALAPAMRLFNVGGTAGSAFVLGLISGYPVGAKTAISLYENGQCSKTEAERLLSFCNNTGPAFVLGSVGIGIFNSQTAGIVLYAAQVAASIITGVLFGLFWRGKGEKKGFKAVKKTSPPLLKCFLTAVKSGGLGIFNICVFVVFFSVAIRLMFLSGIIPLVARLLGMPLSSLGLDPAFFERLATGFFEVVSGVKKAGEGGLAAGNLALSGAILGWAGLSVHCQVLSFLSDSELSAKPYILGKLVQSAVAAAITFLLAALTPLSIPRTVFNNAAPPLVSVTPAVFLRSLYLSAAAMLLLMITALIALYLPGDRPKRKRRPHL